MSKLQTDKKDESTLMRLGHILARVLDGFEVTVLSVGTALLAVLTIVNVFARNISKSIYYAEELSILFVILITFTGTSYAARKARHIRMGAVLELLPSKVEKVLVIIISIVSGIVMLILAYYAFDYVKTLRFRGTKTQALGAPYWTFLIIAPITLFITAVQFFRTVIKNFHEKEVWLSPEQQSEFEDEAVMTEKVIAEAGGPEWKAKESK